MAEKSVKEELLQTNVALYQEIFHIEHLLRKMCYASYIAVANEEWQRRIPNKISESISIRKKLNKPYSYLAKQYFSHPMWDITLYELLGMLTDPEDVWAYFKRKSKSDKEIFISKTRELEYIRNIISHGNNVGPETIGPFKGLAQYFDMIASNFKKNTGIYLTEEREVIFSGRKQEKFVLRHEKEEDLFSYKIYKRLNDTFSGKEVPIEVAFEESDTEIIVSIVSLNFGVPDFGLLLRGLVDNATSNYLMAISVQADHALSGGPFVIVFIISSKIRNETNKQNAFIDYLVENLRMVESWSSSLSADDIENIEDPNVRQELIDKEGDEYYKWVKEIYEMRKLFFYHPLIWDEKSIEKWNPES